MKQKRVQDRLKKAVRKKRKKTTVITGGGTNVTVQSTTTVTGSTSFLGLTDTPAEYVDKAGQFVKVKTDESGVEFDIGSLYKVVASGTDTYTGTLPVTPATNQVFRLQIPNNNTGAATFNPNGTGAKALKKNVTEALAANDLKAGGVYIVHDDGTNYQVIGIGGSGGGGGTPGGSDTQVQYNNAGAFAGISGATTDGTVLNVTTAPSGTNTTRAASTAFVKQELDNSATVANVGAKLYLFNAY